MRWTHKQLQKSNASHCIVNFDHLIWLLCTSTSIYIYEGVAFIAYISPAPTIWFPCDYVCACSYAVCACVCVCMYVCVHVCECKEKESLSDGNLWSPYTQSTPELYCYVYYLYPKPSSFGRSISLRNKTSERTDERIECNAFGWSTASNIEPYHWHEIEQRTTTSKGNRLECYVRQMLKHRATICNLWQCKQYHTHTHTHRFIVSVFP